MVKASDQQAANQQPESALADKPQQNYQYVDLIQAIINEWKANPLYTLKNSETGAIILQLNHREQAKLAIEIREWYLQEKQLYMQEGKQNDEVYKTLDHLLKTLMLLLNQNLPFTLDEVLEFLAAFRADPSFYWWEGGDQITKIVECYLADHELTTELKDSIDQTCHSLERHLSSQQRKYAIKLQQLMGVSPVKFILASLKSPSGTFLEDVQASVEKYSDLIQSIIHERNSNPLQTYKFQGSTTGKVILRLSRSEQAELAVSLMRWYRYDILDYLEITEHCRKYWILEVLILLLSRKLPFTEDNILEFLTTFQADEYSLRRGQAQIVNLVQNHLENHPLTPELKNSIQRTCGILARQSNNCHTYITKLKKLIYPHQTLIAILPGEAWSDQAIQQIKILPEANQVLWHQLLETCTFASGSKPTTKWLRTAQTQRKEIELKAFTTALLQWFLLVDQPHTQPLPDWRRNQDFIDDKNADILKGLVWLCADLADAEIARSLSKLAVSAYRKIPGIGPRCVKLGNACVWALGEMPTQDAIAQLALLKVKVKFGSAQQGIEKALTAAAERQGISREEIEELSVPTYGLTDVGLRRETLGEFTAELEVTGTSSTSLRWLKADGKPQKSVPKAVKDNYADQLKELKQAAKDIQNMLPAQRDRIESLYLQQKTWDFATWQERYLNHPLVGTLARRLLWQFESGEGAESHHAVGIWLNGQIVNLENQPLDWLTDTTKVSLWHPITASAATIQAWRNWLIEHQVQQPFKQAHREIYLLTAAEENTRVYSNRFAAHVIKQHQFNALCGQRGWKNQLRLMVDDDYNPATLWLPQWGLRAEFWIEGIGDHYGIDTNETGTYLYLSTDQVRFYGINAVPNSAHAGGGGYSAARYRLPDGDTAPVPLEDIPALVFTEVMRDVDLFVGVASVGNDPNWSDGGPEGRHYDYWQSYSFGELSATAQTRRQVLENLIPKLKICDRCFFQDRFLIVRGDIRTYKIHLGSGNILMEPNDQYLCIVQGQGHKASPVFLPFEGDRMLAIVLSKALLLANDTAITDPTILSQIGRNPT